MMLLLVFLVVVVIGLKSVCRGQDVTLECHSEAFPKSINFWVNNKGAMLVSSIHHHDDMDAYITMMSLVVTHGIKG